MEKFAMKQMRLLRHYYVTMGLFKIKKHEESPIVGMAFKG